MHGVKRTAAPTASARAARREKEAAKLQGYLKVEGAFFTIVSEMRTLTWGCNGKPLLNIAQ